MCDLIFFGSNSINVNCPFICDSVGNSRPCQSERYSDAAGYQTRKARFSNLRLFLNL